MLVPTVITVQAITAVALIELEMGSTFMKMLMGLYNIVSILANTLYFGVFATVFVQSDETLKRCRKPIYWKPGTSKWTRRFFRSCAPIRVQLGSINFFDRLTVPNFVNFGNDITLQLILVSRSK